MSDFLGQNLSNRWFEKGSPDPIRLRIWAALRYVAIVVSIFLLVMLAGRSPGGAFLTGVGFGMAFSGLVNILLLPRAERSPRIDLLLLTAGLVCAGAGIFILSSS